MKFKTIVLLAFAVGCGLVAMMGVQQVLADRANRENASKVKVLVAAVDIMPGVPLDETNTTTKEWPRDLVPEGAITTKEQYVDRALKAPAVAGEMLLTTKLTEKGQFGASAAIPPGMRVVTIPVNETKTHSGMLMPGDRVDILVTYKAKVENVGLVSKTRTLLEYIEVFASDNMRTAENGGDGKEVKAKNISLLVTPQQVEIIKLASDKGSLDLSLRGKGDDELVANRGVDESLLEELSSGMNSVPKSAHDEEIPAAAPMPVANTEDIQKFLGGTFYPEEAKKPEPVVNVLPAPEPVPTWRVQIYSGEEVIQQDFALPKNASEEARKAAIMVIPENDDVNMALLSQQTGTKAQPFQPSGLTQTNPAENGPADMTDLIKSFWKPNPQDKNKANAGTQKDLENLLNKGMSF